MPPEYSNRATGRTSSTKAEHDSDTKTKSDDADTGAAEARLDWGQAEVRDGTLTVSVAGEPPDGWKETFEKTAALLSSGEWETVRVKKHAVKVQGVRPGTEDKLKHFLESIVQQANATHAPEDEDDAPGDAGAESGEDDEPGDAEGEERSEDTEMTERFRSFATSD
jgi:hypothetical protein